MSDEKQEKQGMSAGTLISWILAIVLIIVGGVNANLLDYQNTQPSCIRKFQEDRRAQQETSNTKRAIQRNRIESVVHDVINEHFPQFKSEFKTVTTVRESNNKTAPPVEPKDAPATDEGIELDDGMIGNLIRRSKE